MHFVDVNKFGKNRIFTTSIASAKQLNSIEIMSTIVNIYNAVQLKRPPYKGTNCTLTPHHSQGHKKTPAPYNGEGLNSQ